MENMTSNSASVEPSRLQLLKGASYFILDAVIVGMLFINSAFYAWESQLYGPIQHLAKFHIVIQHSFGDHIMLVLVVLNYLVYDKMFAFSLILAGWLLFGTPYYYLVLALASFNFGIDFGTNVWMKLQRSEPSSSTS